MKYFFLFLFLSVVLLTNVSCKRDKVAYMEIKQVFNQFKYKQELEKELAEINNQRKFKLDSLAAELKILSNKAKSDSKNKDIIIQFETQRELYLQQRSIFEEEQQQMVKAYDEKIISQLNSYVKQFGKENNYSMIFGATTDGSVMYSDTTLNISADIIKYINNKYSGN